MNKMKKKKSWQKKINFNMNTFNGLQSVFSSSGGGDNNTRRSDRQKNDFDGVSAIISN